MNKVVCFVGLALLSPLVAEELAPNKTAPDKNQDWLNQGIQDKIKQQESQKLQSEKAAEKPNPYAPKAPNSGFQNYKPLDLNRASTPWGTVAPKGLYQAQTPYSQADKNVTLGAIKEPSPLGQGSPNSSPRPQVPSPYLNSGNVPAPSYSISSPTLSSTTASVNGLPSLLNTRSTLTASKDPRPKNNEGPLVPNANLANSQSQPALIKPPPYVPPQRASFGPQTKSVSRIEDPWDILNR